MSTKLLHGKICIIQVGGTLSMTGGADQGGAKPSVDLNALLPPFDGVAGSINFDLLPWKNVPSSYLTSADMTELAQIIQAKSGDEDLLGIVVLHGTDTLEETAFAVDILTSVTKPVVFTGAMKRYDEVGYDGISNIQDAINIVLSPHAVSRGTLIAFGGHILDVAGTGKLGTMGLHPFSNPWAGPCGYCHQGQVNFMRPPAARPGPFPGMVAGVGLLKVYSAMDKDAFLGFAAASPDGLVLEVFGVGTIPITIRDAVFSLLQASVPVIVASQAPQGWTSAAYGFLGGGRDLLDAGCIFAGRLPGRQARLLLMGCLSDTGSSSLADVFAYYDQRN